MRAGSKRGVTLGAAVRASGCAACATALRVTVQQATDDMQDGTRNGQETTCKQGTCVMQQPTRSAAHAT